MLPSSSSSSSSSPRPLPFSLLPPSLCSLLPSSIHQSMAVSFFISTAFPSLSLSNHTPAFPLTSPPPFFASKLCSHRLNSSSPVLTKWISSRIAAKTSDDEWGEDPNGDPKEFAESMADAATAVAEEFTGVAKLKQALIDSLYGTDRGLKASSETRAEIVELITQLEAKNPTPAPTEALPLLNGKWILAYTSFSELFPLLATGTLPLVKVGEISQTIDSDALTVQNSVTFTGPLATTSFSTSASFEVRSPKRVQIKFEEGVIGTPQLTDAIEIPENIDFLGQKIDLTPVQGLLKSLQDAASSVARTISGQPPLKFSIRTDKAQSWLLTTYLDEDLRISRGDGGSVFLLIKEGSSLLN